MNFKLREPCADCPFRRDIDFHLSPSRAQEIADALMTGQTFACHKTTKETGHGNEQHCAGALIFLEAQANPNQLMRIAERIGYYDASQLTGDCYESTEEFVEAMQLLHAD
jgi:hypothetical protein